MSIVCPTGKGYEGLREVVDGINIYRYSLPREGDGALGYLAEYSAALWHTFRLALKVRRSHGFDVVHACNPPDLLFMIGGFFKLFCRTTFIFDHHDINPELYEAKFGRRGLFWKLLVALERLTFRTADVSIATNESYRRIAIERGRMHPEELERRSQGRLAPLPDSKRPERPELTVERRSKCRSSRQVEAACYR